MSAPLVVKGWMHREGLQQLSKTNNPDNYVAFFKYEDEEYHESIPVLVLPLSPSGEPSEELVSRCIDPDVIRRAFVLEVAARESIAKGDSAPVDLAIRNLVHSVLTALCASAQEGTSNG